MISTRLNGSCAGTTHVLNGGQGVTDRALVGNAADPRQVKAAKKQEKANRERERADLQNILESVQGRRFIWKYLRDAGVFRLSFLPGDSHSTAFHEGRRSQGLSLMLDVMQLDPLLYFKMAKEAQELEQMTTPTPKPDDTQAAETGEEENDNG